MTTASTTRADVLLFLRARVRRRASVHDVATAHSIHVDTARALLAQLCRLGLVRSTGTRDRRGWTVYALTSEHLEVALARRSPHPLRTLVSIGWLPVSRAVAALRRAA